MRQAAHVRTQRRGNAHVTGILFFDTLFKTCVFDYGYGKTLTEGNLVPTPRRSHER